MRILFVLKEYFPKPTPPGICVEILQECMMGKNIHSDIIMQGEEDGFVLANRFGSIYSISCGSRELDTTNRNKFRHNIRNIKKIATWPNDNTATKKYIEQINELGPTKYDAIIGVCLPVATACAVSKFPNGYIYELDSITNNPELSRGVRRIFRQRLYRIERNLFRSAKGIFFLKSNEEYYSQKRYVCFRDKMIVVDIPLLIQNDDRQNENTKNKEDPIEMIYTGGLFKAYRNPEYLIRIINEITKKQKLSCKFYTRGDCEDILKRAEEANKAIELKGYVSRQELNKAIDEADVLVSIGNKLKGKDRSLPSKVIEYMATGKMILHLSGGKNDIACDYLKEYENAIIIYPDCDINSNVERIMSFILERRTITLPYESIAMKMKMNTPEYTVNAMIERITNNNMEE